MTTGKLYYLTIKEKIKPNKQLGNYIVRQENNTFILKYYGTSIMRYDKNTNILTCVYDYSISTKCMITKVKAYLIKHLGNEIKVIVTKTKTNQLIKIENLV